MPDLANLNYIDLVVTAIQRPSHGADIVFIGPDQDLDPPEVANFVPSTGSTISSIQTIEFDVTDVIALQRVVVLVNFPNLDLYEVAHDGDSLGPQYRNSFCQRTAISGGYHFQLLRDEGWPASPRIIPIAFDGVGNANQVSSVIYAWTLV